MSEPWPENTWRICSCRWDAWVHFESWSHIIGLLFGHGTVSLDWIDRQASFVSQLIDFEIMGHCHTLRVTVRPAASNAAGRGMIGATMTLASIIDPHHSLPGANPHYIKFECEISVCSTSKGLYVREAVL